MNIRKHILFLMIIFAVSCSESNEPAEQTSYYEGSLSLPQISADGAGCVNIHKWSGGDLMRTTDRIALGTVTQVEVNQDFIDPPDQCLPGTFKWSLKVHLDVSENYKGSGDALTFGISFANIDFWTSKPMYKRDGQWVPTVWGPTPTIQLSDRFGWSDQGGIQVGQEILVFLNEYPEGYVGRLPMATVVGDRVEFQASNVPGSCIEYDDTLTRGLSPTELATAMSEPELSPGMDDPYKNWGFGYPSYCATQAEVDGNPEPVEPID